MSITRSIRRRTASRAALAVATILATAQVTPALAQSVPSAYTTGYRWDVLRHLVGKISPSSSGTTAPFLAERYTYDANGTLIRTEKGYLSAWQAETVLPANWTGFTVVQQVDVTVDPVGNKLTETSSAGGTNYALTQFSYDANDRVTCSAARMNPAIYASLPASACTLGTQGTFGPDRVTKSVYDLAGQVLQIRKAVGVSGTEQAYATYSYTPNGKQEYVVDANGNRAKLEYDGYDRQVKWIFPSQTVPSAYNPATQATALATAGSLNTADFEQYGYDADGNRTFLHKRDGSVLGYTLDALNRVTIKTVPSRADLAATNTRDVYYAFDLLGRQLDARFDSLTGEGVHNVYDAVGRMTSTSLTMDGAARALSYQYDRDGGRTRITWPDNNYATYTYDGLDRPSLIQRSGTSTIASYSYDSAGRRSSFNGGINTGYTYDGIGRLATLTNNPAGNGAYNNQYGFSYNPASQVTTRSATNNTFAWDGGVATSRPYTANGLNQYSTVGGNAYGYDVNGNLTADGVYTYTYDIENRMVSMGGSKTAALRYDPLGRLYEISDGVSTTRFLMGGDELLAEYDAAATPNLLRRYVHGADGGADDPVAWYEGATFTGASERVMRPNWQGSITLVTDNSGTTVYARNTYDEYGYPGSTNDGRFQYTGQAWLKEAGLYYYKARMYSPILGRFMQTDPIGYKDQVNLYAYVANDPVDNTDPTGLSPRWREVMRDLEKDGSLPPGSVEKAESTHTTFVAGVIATVVGVPTVVRTLWNAVNGKPEAAKTTLSEAQAANLARFEGKLPANAGPTTVTVGKDGSVTMSATSPGKVPGSSATYTKTMNAAGETTGYTKTVRVPSGETLPPKDKFNLK